MPEIYVAAFGWRRPEYTLQTVSSFARHNDAGRFHLWYGLDGGPKADPRLRDIFEAYGFRPLVLQAKHVGISRMYEDMICEIASRARAEDLVLTLQNDWESVRPVPIEAVEAALSWPDVQSFELYGRYKGRRPSKHDLNRDRHRGLPGSPRVHWAPYLCGGEVIEVGLAPWGRPPCITPIDVVARMVVNVRSPAENRRRSGEDGGFLVARPVRNVVYHIGRESSKRGGGKV